MSIKAIHHKTASHHTSDSHRTKKQKSLQNVGYDTLTKYIQDLTDATTQNDRPRMQKILTEAFDQQIHAGDLAYAVLHRFRREDQASAGYKNLEQEAKISVIQRAVISQNSSLLNGSFQNLVNQTPEKLVLEVLNEAKKSYPHKTEEIGKLENTITALEAIDFERHKLLAIDTLGIAIKAHRLFEKYKNQTGIHYIHPSKHGLCRALVLDFDKKKYTILSKKHGKLQAHGGFKRVTDAVQVFFTEKPITAKSMVRAVNHFDRKLSKYELEFEMTYGEIDSIVSYRAKRDASVRKTTILQEPFEGDLYIFTAYTPKEERLALSHEELLDILKTVGSTVQRMHRDGVVHRDIKTKNVLFRFNPDGSVSSKLCDFGHTMKPSSTQTNLYEIKKHGTLRYSPPEVLKKQAFAPSQLEQLKALDMYGLGNMLYELVLVEQTPWSHDVWRALKEPDSTAKMKALNLQQNAPEILQKKIASCTNHSQKRLLEITKRLLDPDPNKRMKIDEFMDAIHETSLDFFGE